MTEAGNLLFVRKGHREGGKRASVLRNCCLKMQEGHKAKEELSTVQATGSENRENQRGTRWKSLRLPRSDPQWGSAVPGYHRGQAGVFFLQSCGSWWWSLALNAFHKEGSAAPSPSLWPVSSPSLTSALHF